ncbi:MAG: dephospho-CoA kinase [Flavobacteriales bacterium]|nr:dephospho-CoA kinase [Flavobacteriales bacterium]
MSLKKENKPLLVGLTGGIGSGKSTVAKVFESLSVPVFNSDTVAKSIINNDEEVIAQVITTFGAIYENGKLNSNKMAEVVFNDKTALKKLNNIIHPKVADYFKRWVEENASSPILIKEAAILIESGAYQQMDKIILVTAPEEIRIERVVQRDNVSEDKVKGRMQAQLSDEEKLTYADFTIDNGGKELIIPQVMEIYNQIKKP